MSLASEISSAATEAQSILAQIGGAPAGEANSLYKGAEYIAVYGAPIVERQMLPAGGYRQRTVMQVTATRAQFVAAPVANLQWVRTDLAPQITYRVEKVDLHDPFIYVLTLSRVGE